MWPIRDQLSQNTNRLPAPGLRQSGDGGRSRRRNRAKGKGRGMLRGADLRPKDFHHLQAKAALLVANIAQHISGKGGSYGKQSKKRVVPLSMDRISPGH